MKTPALLLAALALLAAACAEDGPGAAAGPEDALGDPAVYAPEGWPLQIGDTVRGPLAPYNLGFAMPGVRGEWLIEGYGRAPRR